MINSVSVFTGGSSGNILPREDYDPNDGVIPVLFFSTTHSYHLVNADYSLGVQGFSMVASVILTVTVIGLIQKENG